LGGGAVPDTDKSLKEATKRNDVATERFVPGAIKEVVTVYVTFELR
jgi:hypothetical protein